MAKSEIDISVSEVPSNDVPSMTPNKSLSGGKNQEQVPSASVTEDPHSEDKSGVQQQSPALSKKDVPLTEDETKSSTDLLEKAIQQSLQEAALEKELEAISDKLSKPHYNALLGRTTSFGQSMLRDLFQIRHAPVVREKLRIEVESGLMNILLKLRKKQFISADFVEKTSIKLILGRVREDKWGFSDIAKLHADVLYQRFEGQEWGKRAVQPAIPSTTDEEKADGNPRKRNASSSPSKPKKDKKKPTPIRVRKLIPDDDDPVFGLHGSMYGTLIKYTTYEPGDVTKTIILNDHAPKLNPKTHGHNNIEIGTFFPRQLAALARGAHGSSQAGIHGTHQSGAYSVIVTGTYSSLETDGLGAFEYCASGSMDNTCTTTIADSQGLAALRTSLTTARPVRVLRGANDKFRAAPAFGLRYDGLYLVKEEKQRTNDKGGLYATFVMKRMGEQDAVDLTRPNGADLEQYERLKEMLE